MAKARNESSLRSFAIMGARMRIEELQAEIDRIKKQFGGRTLRVARDPTGRSAPGSASTAKPRRRKMSSAARKRISEAQKARWAKQKSEAEAGGRKKK
jgi:hypothetical protein